MTQIQIVRAVLYGVIFWFVAAMVVHFFPSLFDASAAQAALYAASIPIAWACTRVTALAAGVPRGRVLAPTVVATITATFLDGIAMTWTPELYADVSSTTQYGAAWILWGVGWLLLFAYRVDRRP
jgi:hypothetical protein